MSELTPTLVKQLEARIKDLEQNNQKLQQQVERATLLHNVSVLLSTALDFETIVTRAVDFAQYFNATSGEIHLITDTDEVYLKSTYPERNTLNTVERHELVRRLLDEGLDAWVLYTDQLALVLDTQADSRWLPVEHPDQTVTVRSAICAPIKISRGRLKGAISFVHPQPNHFTEQDLNLLSTLTTHISTALENAYQVTDIKETLNEAQLMIDIGRHLSGSSTLQTVHNAILRSIAAIGAQYCTLMMCHGLNNKNLPTHAEITFVGNVKSPKTKSKLLNHRFALADYQALVELVITQDMLVVENLEKDERLTDTDLTLLRQFNAQSMVIYPLIQRGHVAGILVIGHDAHHIFNERELALYRTLSSQTALALEHVNQIQRTETALAETQTLYRAGRVLAGAGGVKEIVQEALVEFGYSVGLPQGAVVLLSPDRQFGELVAYMDNGELQPCEPFSFRVDRNKPNQKSLLAGQPFVMTELPAEAYPVEFSHITLARPIQSILQAPMIMQGETIGWITAVSPRVQHHFSQREADLARAMADQVTIAMQNRRLLEQTERRAEQLQAVATVGKAVTGLTDLSEVLKLTVNLIRDRFGFYHVSIFLIDEARVWAVVKASTGDVGKIMIERPHRLAVGSNSIVGYVTYHAKHRIALDVGKDAVHFNNPLLPHTRSEMALPLVSRGVTIGALDVQSVASNAFTDEDVEALQIMADQITTAIETARLFEEIQRRLHEQAMLYRIGTRIGSTLHLQETTYILVSETAQMLNVAECALTLLEADNMAHTISDYVERGASFPDNTGQKIKTDEFPSLIKIITTKQEVITYADDETLSGWEINYLRQYHGTALMLVPILLHNEVIGLLEVYDNQPNRRFNSDDISLLDSVALLAANAIENARLFEAARSSQAFMKAIINQIPDPIFIKDRNHRWLIANTSFAQGLLGQAEEDILGKTDFDSAVSMAETEEVRTQDIKLFDTGQPQEREETITDYTGQTRSLFTRKIPLTLTPGETKPEYLVGIIQDITSRKQREIERERLITETRRTLKRTQTLFRISNILATSTDRRSTFEAVLAEYLKLLGLEQGGIMLYNKAANSNVTEARFIAGAPVTPQLVLTADQDRIYQRLLKYPHAFVIDDSPNLELIKPAEETPGQQPVTAMLVLPLVIRAQLVGNIIIEATTAGHAFSEEDTEIGQAIAHQLIIWLENRQLLEEAQHRSTSLQTASEVSRAASSILNIEQLIDTSVNLIRDQFDFYYVGIFLLDEPGQWAVLKAGTGEAGRVQLENRHKLRVGGESMIGWCIAHRRARIALDVGEEAVRFRNPVLPLTRSEMALPLISRDQVMGAVTVQSTKRLAFSNEDITLLQTMADQVANAIKNAELFTQTQTALSEAETLYQVTQAISSARDEATVYQLALAAISSTKVDSVAIYTYVTQPKNGVPTLFIQQQAGWHADGGHTAANLAHIKAADFTLEKLIPQQDYFLIDNVATSQRITEHVRSELTSANITSLLGVPLYTHQERLGFFVATYKQEQKKFTKNQIRFFITISQQLIVALENLRLLDDSQKRARREEIIREITSKIRNATDVNDIMKTTVTELGKVIGTTKGRILLEPPQKVAVSTPKNGDTGQ